MFMQENLKKIKRDNALKIFVSVAMVFVFCASVVLAICAPVFKADGVASAYDATLPDDGKVGDNLFNSYDFTTFIGSSSSDFNVWYLSSYGGAVPSFNVGVLSGSSSDTSGAELVYAYSLSFAGKYTFTVSCTDIVGRANFTLRRRVLGSTGGTEFIVSYQLSASVNSFTLDMVEGYEYRFILTSVNGSAKFLFNKFEYGSYFTGFVPDYQNTIKDLQDEVASQKDTVANYNFASRFVAPINTPSRQVYFNLNRYPIVPDSSFFKDGGNFNRWYYMDYFSSYDVNGSIYLGNSVVTLGWELYYGYEGFVPNQTVSFSSAVLLCNGTKIFKYDCSGDSITSLVYTNPTWLVSSNMQFKGIPIYLYDFSGSTAYFTLRDSTILNEQFSNSSWGYSFALQDLNNWKDVSNDVFYNNGYNNGFSEGKESGFSSGHDSGYKEGFSVGKDSGYNIGYSDGVVAGQDYSFTALLGAVFDVPIAAFKGLFNFEVLGVNMTSFVSGLLALCVIVVIVKICLGGK